MPAKTYLRILQFGLIGSLFTIFFVFSDLLFPYITSKQLSFNILMEILLVFWLVFIMRFPEYRPKKNLINYGLLIFFVALFASLPLSVNVNLSFWSNAERMLGIFHILHFLVFYFILITVFRSWKDWRYLLFFSVAIATVISLIGLFGPESYSKIGNTAYVSGYLIFNLYFTVILFLRSKLGAWRYLYILPFLIMFFEFKNMHTSGAIIGLTLSILLFFLLIGLSHVQKRIRKYSLIIFIVAILGVAGVFSQSQTAWFKDSFLKNLTSQKVTFQTRLISWRGALADFKYHPILGTGFGNYAIIFDKHFDPTFFNYTKTETYFDRAHNNLIDITSTTGLLGLLTYLSIFCAAFYYLGCEFKRNGKRVGPDGNGQKNLEIIVIVALIFAYFVQNLAIFDSYTTYIGLMIILGFIYYLVNGQDNEDEEDNNPVVSGDKPLLVIKKTKTEIILLIVLLVVAYLFAYRYNIRSWQMFQGVIKGYSQIAEGDIISGIETYKENFTGGPLEHDGRVTLINLVSSNLSVLDSLKAEQAQAILDYTISLAELNVKDNPADSLMQLQLAQLYDIAARFNYKDAALFNYYSGEAMQAIEYSITSSPRRIPVYLVKAQMQLERGENEEAVKTVQYAIDLNTVYSDSYCRLAQIYIFLKNEKDLGPVLDKCVDLKGVSDISSDKILSLALNYYASRSDYNRALVLGERLAALYNKDPQVMLNLATLYLLTGERDKAQTAVNSAILLDPKLAASGAVLMNSKLPVIKNK